MDFPATASATGQGVVFLVSAGRRVYAGWGDGGTALYRTNASGGWEAVPGQPSGDVAASRVPIRAAYDSNTRALYVTYADAPGPNGQLDGSVHPLDTLTDTWCDVTPVSPDSASGDTFGYGGVAVDARPAGTLVVTTDNRWSQIDTVFRSTDGGASWTSLKDVAVLDVSQTPYLRWGGDAAKFGWWIQTVAVDPYDSHHIVYGTGATIFKTRDLVHWAPQIRGLEESAVRFLLAPEQGGAQLLSGLGDIGVMYHDTLTASPSRGMASNPVFGTATGLALAALRPSYVVRTGWPSGSAAAGAYSEDGGRSWQPFAAQPEIASSAPGPVAAGADGATLLWSFVHWDGTKYPAHRSTDGGAVFAPVAGCQASYALGFGRAAPAKRTGRPGQRPGATGYPAVFQTGRVSAAFDGVAVLRSDDEGATWVRINDDTHQWGWTGEVITGDPRVHGRVYLGTNGRGIQYADPA